MIKLSSARQLDEALKSQGIDTSNVHVVCDVCHQTDGHTSTCEGRPRFGLAAWIPSVPVDGHHDGPVDRSIPDDERKTERPPAKAPLGMWERMSTRANALICKRSVGCILHGEHERCLGFTMGDEPKLPLNAGDDAAILEMRKGDRKELTSLRDQLGDRDHTIAEQQREIGRLTMALREAERKAAKR